MKERNCDRGSAAWSLVRAVCRQTQLVLRRLLLRCPVPWGRHRTYLLESLACFTPGPGERAQLLLSVQECFHSLSRGNCGELCVLPMTVFHFLKFTGHPMCNERAMPGTSWLLDVIAKAQHGR